MLVVYRIGAHVPVPGIPLRGDGGLVQRRQLCRRWRYVAPESFLGGALSYVSVFSLGIMP